MTFNEPIDPASAGAGDLTLSQGTVTGAAVLSPTQVRYTLSGITTEGTLTVTSPAGALTDVFGNPSLAFRGTYTLDIGTVAFPALAPQNPLGSLVYGAVASGVAAPPAAELSTILVQSPKTWPLGILLVQMTIVSAPAGGGGGAPAVVKLQVGPVRDSAAAAAASLKAAAVLLTIFQ